MDGWAGVDVAFRRILRLDKKRDAAWSGVTILRRQQLFYVTIAHHEPSWIR